MSLHLIGHCASRYDMKRVYLALLLIVSLLASGLHIEEPAVAEEMTASGELHLMAHDHMTSEKNIPADGDKESRAVCHHHCPVASAIVSLQSVRTFIIAREQRLIDPDLKLASVATAPPYRPPQV